MHDYPTYIPMWVFWVCGSAALAAAVALGFAAARLMDRKRK